MKPKTRELCDNARKIQNILGLGYHLAVWPNSAGKDCYWLVPDGGQPYEGVYIAVK